MDIAESTKSNYLRVFELLNREYGVTPFDPMAYCMWLVDCKTKLASATWRQYRAASLFYIKNEYPSHHLECDAYLRNIKTNNRATGTIRGKKKGYTESELNAFLDHCNVMMLRPSRWGNGPFWWKNVFYTLKASDIVGLRPCEWDGATLVSTPDRCDLVVLNAKTTHDRSHGETRTIDLRKLSTDEKEAIFTKIDLTNSAIANKQCKNMDEYQRITRDYLLKANNKLFPGADKTQAFYTGRHQVVTEYKSREDSTAEGLAAILGHRSTQTANRHYGRKAKSSKKGLRKSKIEPNKSDVDRVIAFNEGTKVGPPATPSPPSPPATSPAGPNI